MSTFEYTTLLVVGCPLAFVAIMVATVLILAWKPDDRPMASDDPTEDTQDLTEAVDEILAVDPPVVPAYVAAVTELDDMLRHATDPKVRDLLLDRRLKATKETVT